MANIGLVDVDGHNFPNFALMKISAFHKAMGDRVEWASPLFGAYDLVYKSKIFTFSPDDTTPWNCPVIKGGTGYDIKSHLPEEIESSKKMDYSIYPQYPFSVQFLSRGCIRHRPFCLVREKEGLIHPVDPVELNPNGQWIEVLDNNFFANPEWRTAVKYLMNTKQPINFHGIDVRILDEEQAWWLNRIKMRGGIHIAWDLPNVDLTDRLKNMVKYIKPWKIVCYILVGFNSTIEQDLKRIYTCRDLGISAWVMPFRDYENKREPTMYERDLQRWANRPQVLNKCNFEDYEPRKGFKCGNYLK